MDADSILDLLLENLKPLFFPESWLQLDMKFSKTELLSLLFIDKRGDITMTELAEYLNTPMSTANGIIERLVKKGYVSRNRSDTDRRIVVVCLTPEGRQLLGGFHALITDYINMALEVLSEEEASALIGIVLKIARGLREKLAAEEPPGTAELRKISIE